MGHYSTDTKDVIFCGHALNVLQQLADNSVDCIVTSPPYYGLRDYGVDGQLGLEPTVFEYVDNLVSIFREARRVLKSRGIMWLNMGDSYCGTGSKGDYKDPKYEGRNGQGKSITQKMPGFKPKDLMMVPARVAMALQADGWYLRSQIIWHKPSCMPESVKDRPTNDYEVVYLLSKDERYFYNQDAIREPAQNWGTRDRSDGKYTSGNAPISGGPHSGLIDGNFEERGRNARTVWSINHEGFSEAHFATMPLALADKCVRAGCPEGGIVLDPFGGAGTSAIAAINNLCHYMLIELNPTYIGLAQKRIAQKRLEGVQLTLHL